MYKSIARAIIVSGIFLVPAIAFAGSPQYSATNLNVRSGPGVKYQRLGTIPKGEQVQFNDCKDGTLWCKGTWNGRTGWVYAPGLEGWASKTYLSDAKAVPVAPPSKFEDVWENAQPSCWRFVLPNSQAYLPGDTEKQVKDTEEKDARYIRKLSRAFQSEAGWDFLWGKIRSEGDDAMCALKLLKIVPAEKNPSDYTMDLLAGDGSGQQRAETSH